MRDSHLPAPLLTPVRTRHWLASLIVLAAACSGDHEAPTDGGASSALNPSSGKADGGQGDGDGSAAGDGGNPLSVGPDSELCGLNLPLKPRGCSCAPGNTTTCFSGPPGVRNTGKCHDGVQTCEGAGEFGTWGPCVGDETDCGEDVDAGTPPPGACGCVPGTVIQCSEDCSELIICSLTGTKVCQPDGTFSRCQEGNLDNLVSADLCRNIFFGCLANDYEGLFLGVCDDVFTCGHPPGLLPPELTDPPTSGDAGVDAGADAAEPTIK